MYISSVMFCVVFIQMDKTLRDKRSWNDLNWIELKWKTLCKYYFHYWLWWYLMKIIIRYFQMDNNNNDDGPTKMKMGYSSANQLIFYSFFFWSSTSRLLIMIIVCSKYFASLFCGQVYSLQETKKKDFDTVIWNWRIPKQMYIYTTAIQLSLFHFPGKIYPWIGYTLAVYVRPRINNK